MTRDTAALAVDSSPDQSSPPCQSISTLALPSCRGGKSATSLTLAGAASSLELVDHERDPANFSRGNPQTLPAATVPKVACNRRDGLEDATSVVDPKALTLLQGPPPRYGKHPT
jgi:hypothetical protein